MSSPEPLADWLDAGYPDELLTPELDGPFSGEQRNGGPAVPSHRPQCASVAQPLASTNARSVSGNRNLKLASHLEP